MPHFAAFAFTTAYAGLCYDHLSGKLGEELFRYFLDKMYIEKNCEDDEYMITRSGLKWFLELGIDTDKLCSSSRKQVCACIERKGGVFYPHTGAHLGTLITQKLFELGWIMINGDKTCTITEVGRSGLKEKGVCVRENEWF